MTGARDCDLIFGGGLDKLNLMIVIMCPVRQFDDEQITRLEPPLREREREIDLTSATRSIHPDAI